MSRGLILLFLILLASSFSYGAVHSVISTPPSEGKNAERGLIQDAIDQAAPGDTIQIYPGIYAENITIEKSLTLMAVPDQVDPVGIFPGGGIGIDISAPYVTVQGLTIHGVTSGIQAFLTAGESSANSGLPFIRLMDNVIYDVADDSLGFGILVGTASERYNPDDPLGIYDPTLNALLDFSGLRISGNEIFETTGSGLAIRSLTRELFDPPFVYGNYVHDCGGSGLWIDAVWDITLENNMLASNGRGILLTNFSDGYNEGLPNNGFDPKNISAIDNSIKRNGDIGVAVYDGFPEYIEFHDNDISENAVNFLNFLEIGIDAEANYWGALLCADIADGLSGNIDYDPWCDPYLSYCELTCNLTEVWVDDDYCELCHNDLRYWGYNAFASIHDAIRAVNEGGTIYIKQGNYSEQIIVNKNLTINGSIGAKILPPFGGLAGVTVEETGGVFYPMILLFGGSSDESGHISGAETIDVTVTGLTIDGNGAALSDNFIGLLIRNGHTSSEASGNSFINMQSAEENFETYGILVLGNSDVYIGNNVIQDFSRGAIALIGDNGPRPDPGAEIVNNAIIGDGSLTGGRPVPFGVAVNYGAVASITGNEISDLWCLSESDTARAIDINYPGTGMIIDNNDITGCEAGAYLNFIIGASIGNGNVFSGNDHILVKNCAGVNFDDNVFNNNGRALSIMNSFNIGLTNNSFSGNDYCVGCEGAVSMINITGNYFSGSAVAAIYIDDIGGIEPSGVHLNNNVITANATAVDNRVPIMLDAAGNWWGSPTGPGTSYNGVSSYVDYSPWWKANYVPSSHGFPWRWGLDSSNNSSFQEAVDYASDGDSIFVMAGLYRSPLNIENRNNLTIFSENRDSTIYAPTSTLNWATGSAGDTMNTAVRMVGSTGIYISGMTFNFSDIQTDNTSGILFWNSKGSLVNCSFRGMGTGGRDDGQNRLMIYMDAAGPLYSHLNRARVNVLYSSFFDCGRDAVNAMGFSDLNLYGNELTRDEPGFGFGAEVGSTATASIRQNAFYGFVAPPDEDPMAASAVYVNSSASTGQGPFNKTVSIEGNEIEGCLNGIILGNLTPGQAGDVDLVGFVRNNFISNCVAPSSGNSGGIVIIGEDGDVGSLIILYLTGNEIKNNGNTGLLIYADGNGDIDATITDNYFIGNETGLVVEELGASSSSIFDLTVHHNLFDNELDAIDNAAGGYWDDGVSDGNCWSAFEGTPGEPYTIPGTGGTIDRFANVTCQDLCDCHPGNADGDSAGIINLLDILYLISNVYQDGPDAIPYATCSADANCDCDINLLDILTLIQSVYFEAEPPCSCGQWLGRCHSPIR